MNAVILWKEYRQQRVIWLVMALVPVLLMIALSIVFMPSHLSYWTELADGGLRGEPRPLVVVMVIYGLVCGALLLAGEREGRTLEFLDCFPQPRSAVWRAKLFSGLLLITALALFLGLVSLTLRDWEAALLFAPIGLDSLIWGLLGGALCRNVLLACVAGTGFMAVSWVIPLAVGQPVPMLILKALIAPIGLLASARIYSRPDAARIKYAFDLGLYPQPAGKRAPARLRKLFPQDVRILLWISMRQGRWVLLAGLVASLALAPVINMLPLILYPAATLALGIMCGLAVFLPEQSQGRQAFLGAQRFPPGKLWSVKIAFWAAAAALLTALTWCAALGVLILTELQSPNSMFRIRYDALDRLIEQHWHLFRTQDPGWFAILWALHGFCVGQFFAFWSRQAVSTVVLAGLVGVVLSALWLPAVIFGGLWSWQVLGAPVLLLLGTRLFVWRWLAGQQYAWRCLLRLGGLLALAVLWLVVSIRYRVVEVPDVGAPFDIDSFVAGIPPAEKNEAGKLIWQAVSDMEDYRLHIQRKLPPPDRPHRQTELARGAPPRAQFPYTYSELVADANEHGWPKEDAQLSRWLDLMFQGAWFKEIHRAARLPLGVFEDPRGLDHFTSYKELGACRQMAVYLSVRAAQLEHKRDFAGSLDEVATLLGLSRQLCNHGSVMPYLTGQGIERTGLFTYQRWLGKVGPDSKLLRKGLALLQSHANLFPDPTDPAKAEYFAFENNMSEGSILGQLLASAGPWPGLGYWRVWRIAFHVPWEHERQQRLTNACFLGSIERIQGDYQDTSTAKKHARSEASGSHGELPREFGLPPAEGSGSRLDARQWTELLHHSCVFWGRGNLVHISRWTRPVYPRGELLVAALALYQAENGKLPASLAELTPRYLPALPIDPFSGQEFHYRISKGNDEREVLKFPGPAQLELKFRATKHEEVFGQLFGTQTTIRLAAGQALVWSDGTDSSLPPEQRRPENRILFPVPKVP